MCLLEINGSTHPHIYFSILYAYLKSTSRAIDQQSLTDVSNTYLSLGPWVFSQNVMNERDKQEKPQVL